MNERTVKALEFNTVKAMIADMAFSPAAKKRILDARPTDNVYLIRDSLAQLDELVRFTMMFSAIPVGGYSVNDRQVERALKGGVLSNDELISISRSIRCASEVKSNILSDIKDRAAFEFLTEYAENITDLKRLSRLIDDIVLDSENISDRASSELYSLRRQKRNINARIREKLNSIVHSKSLQKYLSENIVTIRYNRFVVPVKSEYRSKIEGIVHDTSQSGATVYIEPQSVINMNNELKEIDLKEQREIERILRDLSEKVAASAVDLDANERILITLDEINAKCQFSINEEYMKPEISEDGEIFLEKARHPLISLDDAVKSDILMPGNLRAFVITGPNTGGKTVALKTVGLCQMLFQSGMFIPATDKSRLPVFSAIFADIGDEQSIEQSLSTFSAHMTNIIEIVRSADENTLVLLDEICAGTDPVEGAAIATAVIDILKNRGARVFCTTHYSELKEYALVNDDVVNASVEFDVKTLSPTYRLTVGIPGKSNAFEISRKLGLDEEVLKKADLYLSEEDNRFEDVIKNLNEKTLEAEKKEAEARRLMEENEELNERLKAQTEQIEKSKSKIMLDASLEGKKLISQAKEESRKIINRLNKLEKQMKKGGGLSVREETLKLKGELKNTEDLLNRNIPEHELTRLKSVKADKRKLKAGDEVYIPSLSRKATVLSMEPDDFVYVQAGIIKTRLPLSSVEAVKDDKSHAKKVHYAYSKSKAKSVKGTLDIRGQYSDDAELNVEKYLDDAYLAGLGRVVIIHGRGSGVLRRTVQDILKNHPQVKRYGYAGMNEGGDGATVVVFK